MGPTTGLIAVGIWLAVANPWGSDASQQLARLGLKAHNQRDYASAVPLFKQGYNINIADGNKIAASRFMQGLGATYLADYKFRDALASLMEARRLALEVNDLNELGAIVASLASLYLQTNDIAAARQTVEQALEYSKRLEKPHYRTQLLYILATVAERQSHGPEAIAFYRKGIDIADSEHNDRQLLVGLNRLALVLLNADRLDESEHAALEVFRHRYLRHDPDLVFSYPILAELDMLRGNLDQAKMLSQRGLDLAIADPRGLPLHEFQRIHARVLEKRAEYRPAHKAFLAALTLAGRWRLDLLPSDNSRVAGESSLAPLYDQALANAAHLYFDLHQRDVITDAWLQAEHWRASSLRRFLADRQEWQTSVGPEYWGILAQFRRLDSTMLRAPTKVGLFELERLQVRLAELESFAGVRQIIDGGTEKFSSVKALTPYQSSLRESQSLISFQLGERVSHRWTLGSTGLTWARLPPRAEIAQLSDRFREAVANGSESARTLGLKLGDLLFGGLNRETELSRSWVLALDDALFQVPFPALLRSERNGREGYLIENHSLVAVPGAWSLAGKPASSWRGDFLGIADAVYNSADPRWVASSSNGSSRPGSAGTLQLVSEASLKTASSQLPRLAASAEEVESAARSWHGNAGSNESVFLTGNDASLQGLTAALERRPSIIHFATHVIPNPKVLGRVYIALSLTPDGTPELLSTSDVARMKAGEALVVLSGCHSGSGPALPGSGLIGLVRAWLMSGAAAVIASLWPTPDDRGVIFESFYRELRVGSRLPSQTPVQSAAEALRRAQLEMLRTNSWRAQPKYWATYLITARTG